MTPEARFLASLAQAVSVMSLYEAGHPAREGSIARAYENLNRLQETHPSPRFTFLEDQVVVDGRPLRDLRRWDWTRRLCQAGIQRLEFLGGVTEEDFETFLDEAHRRLSGEAPESAASRPARPTQIRYGALQVRTSEDEGDTGDGRDQADLVTATVDFTLKDEFEAVGWMHSELKDGQELPLLEAEALVRSLSVAMHGDQSFLIPLVRMKQFDQYTTTHALNVSVLAMALAESVGLSPREVRAFGISGLLHDLGKVTVPEDILNKPGKLTDDERAVMNGHPSAGARLILQAEEHLDVAAVVAYEHHIKIDGGGYPSFRYSRRCHQASDMVHICDVFDALRTHRPYREAWDQERVLTYLEEGAGSEFDPDLAHAFVRMVRRWSERIATVEDPDEALPFGNGLQPADPEPASPDEDSASG